MEADRDSAGVTVPPPLVFIGALIAGLVLDHFAWWHFGIPIGRYLHRLLGWSGVIAGFAIMMTALGLFRKAGTDPKPWKPATNVVTDGVYRWTRNPMYLGMALIYAGLAILNDSLIALLMLIPVVLWIQRNVIEREEAYLSAKFGAPYLAYKASVRRWF